MLSTQILKNEFKYSLGAEIILNRFWYFHILAFCLSIGRPLSILERDEFYPIEFVELFFLFHLISVSFNES